MSFHVDKVTIKGQVKSYHINHKNIFTIYKYNLVTFNAPEVRDSKTYCGNKHTVQ